MPRYPCLTLALRACRRSVALVLAALLLTACAQSDFRNYSEHMDAQPAGNAELREMQFRPMRIDRRSDVTLGNKDGYFNFGAGANFYDFLRIPGADEPLTLFVKAFPFNSEPPFCKKSAAAVPACGERLVSFPAFELYDENFGLLATEQPELSVCMQYGINRGFGEGYDFAVRFGTQLALPAATRYLAVASRPELAGKRVAVSVLSIVESKSNPYRVQPDSDGPITQADMQEYVVVPGGELELLLAQLPANVRWPDEQYPDRCEPVRATRTVDGVRKRAWALKQD